VNRRRRSRPEALGDLVPKVLGELGYDRANALTRLAERWEAVVGAQAAAHSRPTGLRGRVLEATVDSSVWSQQLQMRREEIIEALVRELGDEAPTDLWLRVG
jgi:predicted nucleic acid-binding Zn ribbon protein